MAGISSFYKKYYQGEHLVNTNYNINKILKDRDIGPTHFGRSQFHKIMLDFLGSRGIDTTIFRKYKNNSECQSRINAMFTIIKKEGLSEEFMDYYHALKGGDTSDEKSNHQG